MRVFAHMQQYSNHLPNLPCCRIELYQFHSIYEVQRQCHPSVINQNALRMDIVDCSASLSSFPQSKHFSMLENEMKQSLECSHFKSLFFLLIWTIVLFIVIWNSSFDEFKHQCIICATCKDQFQTVGVTGV